MGKMIFVGLDGILKDKIDAKKASNKTRTHEELATESIIEMENTINSLQAKAKNEVEKEIADRLKKEISEIKKLNEKLKK